MVGNSRLWRITAIALTIVLIGQVSVAATAADSPSTDAQTPSLPTLAEAVERYNDYHSEVPSIVKETLSDERVVVTLDSGESYYVKMGENAKIINYSHDGFDSSPTIRVETDTETVRRIIDANDNRAAAIEAFNSGDITAEGTNMMTKLKVSFAKSVIAAGNYA